MRVHGSAEQPLLALAKQPLSLYPSSIACKTVVLVYPERYAVTKFKDSYNNLDSGVVTLNDLDTLVKVTFVLRYVIQCSIVLYPSSLTVKAVQDQHWLRHIPGGIFRSFHFVTQRAETVRYFCWQCPFIRRLHNVLVLPTSETNEFGRILTPNRFNGDPDFLHAGKVLKNEIILEHPMARKYGPFWNK